MIEDNSFGKEGFVMRIDMLIVSGFSGSGKGTILNRLLSSHPEFELIESYTTRQKRNESDFYSFVGLEDFLSLKDEGFFLECNMYSGEWYGTPIIAVEKCINSGKVAIVEVDSNGYSQIMESSLAKKIRIASAFVVADADTIIDRLLRRNTESLEKILTRIKTSIDECLQISSYDFVLPNYDINESVAILKGVISGANFQPTDFDASEYIERMKKILWLLDD